MLVLTSAGTAILAGLLTFPILMSGPVVASEAPPTDATRSARLPTPSEVEPDERIEPESVCTCQTVLTQAD
ncbi:hypothetical protein [Roseivivax jejudonensis]|nr:hypothetical protein [Roseivivax jejudonensis]